MLVDDVRLDWVWSDISITIVRTIEPLAGSNDLVPALDLSGARFRVSLAFAVGIWVQSGPQPELWLVYHCLSLPRMSKAAIGSICRSVFPCESYDTSGIYNGRCTYLCSCCMGAGTWRMRGLALMYPQFCQVPTWHNRRLAVSQPFHIWRHWWWTPRLLHTRYSSIHYKSVFLWSFRLNMIICTLSHVMYFHIECPELQRPPKTYFRIYAIDQTSLTVASTLQQSAIPSRKSLEQAVFIGSPYFSKKFTKKWSSHSQVLDLIPSLIPF